MNTIEELKTMREKMKAAMTKAQLVSQMWDGCISYYGTCDECSRTSCRHFGINEIADICQKMAGDEGVDQSWESESTRYMFSDDSVIVISGPCWDFGYTDCFCMADTGHDENCIRDTGCNSTKGENK